MACKPIKINEIRNRYFDFSDIFKKKQDQRFIDPVHIGSIGQLECAELIGEKIISLDNQKVKHL